VCAGTNRQTDGQKYDPQDRANIAASRGKKSMTLNDLERSKMIVWVSK